MDLMLALALTWKIQPAATTSSNFIRSSTISDTTCKAQTLKQFSYIQLCKLATELYFHFSCSQEGKLILIKRSSK